jgi:hypothetical protein
MEKTIVKALIISSISASIGLLISQNTPAFQSFLTVPMTAWILYQFSSPEKAWNSFSAFQNPAMFSINAFFLSFTYASWKVVPIWNTIYLSTGVFLVAGAVSTLLHKYWNIGG